MQSLVLVFFSLAIILSLYEFAGVLKARLAGLTKSTGRVVLRGVVFGSTLALLWQHWEWKRYIELFTQANLENMRVGNTPFLVSGFAVGLIALLIMSDAVAIWQARAAGLTKNVSRIATSVLIFLSLLPIMYETVRMWDRYMEKVEGMIPSFSGVPGANPQAETKTGMELCLWFDKDAEQAANYYVSIFKDAQMGKISRYGEAGKEFHQQKAGAVMTAEFTLNGIKFTALNGGPMFKFNEAISIQVMCKDQAEVDYYWEKLGQGGDPKAQQCGWLKDKYGLSWQIIPVGATELVSDPKNPASQRAMAAMLKMKKLDLAALQAAYAGN